MEDIFRMKRAEVVVARPASPQPITIAAATSPSGSGSKWKFFSVPKSDGQQAATVPISRPRQMHPSNQLVGATLDLSFPHTLLNGC